MDPVGPWSAYASYNRLAGVQAGAASGDFHHHLASAGSGLGSQSVPSTTSQLLLQAAHTNASLAGQLSSSTASPFNPGGFLSPPTVGYDTVFSPLFHHANPKPAHYSSSLQAQHRQVIAQAQAAVASKQSSVETELSSLRENYPHQALATQGTSFFDQPSTPGGASGLSWQGNNQLPSPFGILPHETVVPSSPSPATTKASASYENFNAHFAAAQTLNNHLNSQISSANKQGNRSGSPATAPKQPTSSSGSTFFQTPPFGNQTDNSYSTSSAKSGQLSTQQDYAGKQRANTASSVAPSSQQQNVNSAPQDSNKIMEKKFNVPVTGPGAGFMASYLKFLQGERDTSPPPAGRGARKATWSRAAPAAKPYAPPDAKPADANGGLLAPGMSAAPLAKAPDDDPRYYNLNKERKRKLDEEAGYEAVDEEGRRLHKPVLNVPASPLDKGKKRAAPKAAPPAAGKKPRAPAPPPQPHYYYQPQPDEGAFNLLDFHLRSRARW